jgi:hypothetical protein
LILATVLAAKPLAAQDRDHRQDHDQLTDRDQSSDHDQVPALPHGVPYDWSHHHLIFSNPGTAEEAMRKGTYDHWFLTVNDPRYIQRQIWMHRRKLDDGPREHERRIVDANGGLWGESLGSASATVGAGMYPAKYSFDSNTLNCANVVGQPDFVVYNTSVPGSGTQATVVAFDNIYAGTCPNTGSYRVPQAYWSYNTSGAAAATVSTSVVLSTYGDQVAFVQSASNVASLVILRYEAGEGTSASAPSSALAAHTYTCTSTAGSCSSQASSYVTCKLGTTSCALVLQFSNDSATAPNDTNSPPYYDYAAGSDTIWVGDDLGYMHKFTSVFGGTPTEAVGGTFGGWPVQVSTETRPNLTGAVYEGVSKRLYVNDATGYLHQVSTTGASTQTTYVSGQMECGTTGFPDGPIVDSTTGNVYIFAGDGCDGGAPTTTNPGNSYINRFNTSTNVAGTGFVYASFGNKGTNSTTTVMHIGTFDNLYYEGTGTTGNVYDCVNGEVYQTTVATLNGAGPGATTNPFAKVVSGTLGTADACSPVSEFLGTTASTTLGGTSQLSATATSVPVSSTTGFAANDYIEIDSEIMRIGATLTNPLTLTRAQGGTKGATHDPGAAVNDVKDWLFMSVAANGNATGCTGACLYSFNVLTASGTATAGRAVAGGTSGITVDNSALSGGSQIYFTYQGAATAGAPCPSPSSPATGSGCAVQAMQSGLN